MGTYTLTKWIVWRLELQYFNSSAVHEVKMKICPTQMYVFAYVAV